MNKDITVVPEDYIVKHTKTDSILKLFATGECVYEVSKKHIPLIYCKDCICFRTDEKNITYCASMGVQIEPDDFCSYGEREGE